MLLFMIHSPDPPDLGVDEKEDFSNSRWWASLKKLAVWWESGRKHGISEQMVFTWRQRVANMSTDAVVLQLIESGKPWQNGLNESFNGKFRDECLSMEWFRCRAEARVVIEEWRRHYNSVRPHSSLNNMTPEYFCRQYGKKHEPWGNPQELSGPKFLGRSGAYHGLRRLWSKVSIQVPRKWSQK
jgi:putative transposase